MNYIEENRFDATVEDVQEMTPIKTRYQIPLELQSCHTAIVDGYVIEGHVPVSDINRLVEEHPGIIGLAVTGMPIGSPGMDGAPAQPFDVTAFDAEGNREVYAHYPKSVKFLMTFVTGKYDINYLSINLGFI